MTRKRTRGDRLVSDLSGQLAEGVEWDERETATLDLIRAEADRVETLDRLFTTEVDSPDTRPRLVAELAAELRLHEAQVAKLIGSLQPDPSQVRAKSAPHQRAALARWHPAAG